MLTAVIALSISNVILLVLWLVTQWILLGFREENRDLETKLDSSHDEIDALLIALHDNKNEIYNLKN